MRAYHWAVIIFFSIFIGVFLCICFYIANFKSVHDISGEKYLAVVFGAGIKKSGEPSNALKYRLDKALELYREKKINKIFISGKVPETVVMKNYLYRHEMNSNDLVIDTGGENTRETVENVKKYMEMNGIETGAAFISQQYHIPRIELIVSKKGLRNSAFVAADAKKIDNDESIMFIARESMAYIKSIVFE